MMQVKWKVEGRREQGAWGIIFEHQGERHVFNHVWALYARQEQILWSFPKAMAQNKKEDIIRMCTGLSQFSIDILGGERNVAMILVEPPDPIRDPIPILTITIDDYHFFVIANPEVTARMITLQAIPSELENLLKGVLIGNAVLLYSRYYNSMLFENKRAHVDEIFQRALTAVGNFTEEDAYVGEGICSLSGLSLPELMLFSYYLRKAFAMERQPLVPGDWLLISGRFGVPIHFSFNLNLEEKTLLSGLLASIGTFSENVIGGKPTRMIFGESVVKNFYMLFSDEAIMAFTHPDLFFISSVQARLDELDPRVREGFKKPLRDFLIHYLTETHKSDLQGLTLDELLQKRRIRSFIEAVSIQSPRIRVGTLFRETIHLLKTNPQLLKKLKENAHWRVLVILDPLERHAEFKEYLLMNSQGQLPPMFFPKMDDIRFEAYMYMAKLLDVSLATTLFLAPRSFTIDHVRGEMLEQVDCFLTFFHFQSASSFLQAMNQIEKIWSIASREIPILLVGLLPPSESSTTSTISTRDAGKEQVSAFMDELTPEQQVLHYLAEFEDGLPERLREIFLFLPLDTAHEKSFGYLLSALAVLKVKMLTSGM